MKGAADGWWEAVLGRQRMISGCSGEGRSLVLLIALESAIVTALLVGATIGLAVEKRGRRGELPHTENLVGEEHDRGQDHQQQAHLQLLFVERFVVHVLLFHPNALHHQSARRPGSRN